MRGKTVQDGEVGARCRCGSTAVPEDVRCKIHLTRCIGCFGPSVATTDFRYCDICDELHGSDDNVFALWGAVLASKRHSGETDSEREAGTRIICEAFKLDPEPILSMRRNNPECPENNHHHVVIDSSTRRVVPLIPHHLTPTYDFP